MNEYPEWLVDRMAAVMYEAPSYLDEPEAPGADHLAWPPKYQEDRQWWLERAAATLDVLGFAPYGGVSYWRSDIQWEAK